MMRKRSAITRAVREQLHAEGYLEIETPVLQLVHGGAAARPFRTHLNAFDIDMTLRIALELYLKRAMVGGADRAFEIGRIFRNEGIDSSHSAEFTMLEAYQSWGDQWTIAAMTRRLVLAAADAVGTRVYDSPAARSTWTANGPGCRCTTPLRRRWATPSPLTPPGSATPPLGFRGIAYDPKLSEGKLVMELFAELVEPTLVQPTFVCDFPAIAQPLARPHRDDPRKVEAWDLIIGGVERGTGFSELIDPVIQRQRLVEQS